jgi:S-disulfanyl-L-cysteine oxidoreductase SoxD
MLVTKRGAGTAERGRDRIQNGGDPTARATAPCLLSFVVGAPATRTGFVVGFLSGLTIMAALGVVVWLVVSGPGDAARSPLATRGEQIYAANCASCHGGATGGAMMDYPPKHNANGHTWHHADCEIVEGIRTGTSPMIEMMRGMMAPPGAPTMPAWREKLSGEEIEAVLAYIKTMWTPGQRDLQERATREQC